MMTTIIAIVVTLVIAVPVSAIIATNAHERKIEKLIGDANDKAKEITEKAERLPKT